MKKVIVFLVFMLFCTATYAQKVSKVVFFGDSLTDNGNLFRLVELIPKTPPYYQGRFSNGPTWAENLGEYFVKTNGAKYEIYAYAGATAAAHNIFETLAPTLLVDQVARYLETNPSDDKSKVLFVFWIGANDYLFLPTGNADELTTAAIQKTANGITTLLDQGAQNFLILDLPDLSKTPFAADLNMVSQMGSFTILHNQKLASLVDKMQKEHPQAQLMLFQLLQFSELIENPAKYNAKYHLNLSNTRAACWQGSVFDDIDTDNLANKTNKAISNPQPEVKEPILCEHPEQYVFFDHLHPTATVHQLLAALVEEAMNNRWS
nr:carboxylesterase [uncultured bacterium]